MTRYSGIHHLAFATRDMEATIRFWRDLLGMRLVYGYGRPGYRQYFFAISDTTMLSFFEWPEVERVAYRRHGEPVKGPFVFDHVSIGVADDQSLWEVADLLAGADFPISDIIDHGFIHSIYGYDPNGIPIEFSCDAPGVDVRAHPRLVDHQPPAAFHEGSEPRPHFWPPAEPLADDERIIIPGEGVEHFKKP